MGSHYLIKIIIVRWNKIDTNKQTQMLVRGSEPSTETVWLNLRKWVWEWEIEEEEERESLKSVGKTRKWKVEDGLNNWFQVKFQGLSSRKKWFWPDEQGDASFHKIWAFKHRPKQDWRPKVKFLKIKKEEIGYMRALARWARGSKMFLQNLSI